MTSAHFMDLDRDENVPRLDLHMEVPVPELPESELLEPWLLRIVRQEGRTLQRVLYHFMNDAQLLQLNQQFLNHNTYTDIITFPYGQDPVEAEIFISIERVRANAQSFAVPVHEELLRVMAHGILHICGWDDHSDLGQRLMRQRENACMSLFG